MKKIIINIGHYDSRAAIIENDQLVEFYVEKPKEELVGNIYLGKVVNVLPGMQAAFIDIGIGKNAFLYVHDAIPPNNNEGTEESPNIREVLTEGQQIIVQVQKEPFGNKGPRVTTHISIPGRYLVYMPESNYVGVSKRIEKEEDRNYYREIGLKVKQDDEGVIIRTAALEANEEQMKKDFQFLRNLWEQTSKQSHNVKAPALIYKDLSLAQRLVRDLLTADVNQFIIDNGFEFKKVKEMVNTFAPELVDRLYMYSDKEYIFDSFNIQSEIDKATKRKVWLKSGGYIIIDKTEALTSIDVNTGKYIGQSNLEDTVLKTNLEAAVEIAKQLRLRDIGGIIIIDFIDMEKDEHKQRVLSTLEEEMKKDKTKSNILGLTQLGLVEMTRKKVRQSLDHVLLRTCPLCDGGGRVTSENEMINRIQRDIKVYKDNDSIKELIIEIHPNLMPFIIGQNASNLHRLEEIVGKKILIKGNETLHFHQFHVLFEYNKPNH